MSDPRRLRLEQQAEAARRDLAELEEQLLAGEIDPDEADRLRSVYRAELTAAEAGLGDEEAALPPTRSRTRALVGAAILLGGAAAIVIALVAVVEPRDGGSITGGVPDRVASTGVDLSTVTNEEMEAVIAANPDNVGMRLALARRYVEAGDFSRALAHYQVILEEQNHPEALAYIGWMSYLSGEADLAARYLELSLDEAPDYRLAQWFLANVRLDALDDPAGAIPLLEALLGDAAVPEDVRAAAEQMLAQARAEAP